jgi:hypothetical protein
VQEAEEVRKLMAERGITVKEGEVLNKRELQQKEFERKTKEQQARFELHAAHMLPAQVTSLTSASALRRLLSVAMCK